MISIPKSSGLTACSQIVPAFRSQLVNVIPKKKPFVPKCKPGIHPLPTAAISACTGLTGGSQVRFSHTDVRVPDVDDYRRHGNVSNTDKNKGQEDAKLFTYLMAAGFGTAGVYAGKDVVYGVVSSISATKDILAMAKVEVSMADIPEGKTMIFKWRGKPLFIRHRTAEEIEAEQNVDLTTLRDPQHDTDRCKDPKFLICVGICTHLGCVPVAEAGDFNGYYCPCHGSHYDASGRIRKGPAPLNLDVPFYEYTEENSVVVG
ncbi:cytochrome b-c1 complex subunit Rieske, mitochondrial-like [Dreissena polymorpha]|uniref:Cytochrome b-c1 complex subunit Rieske, mitochondrial n=1 Tax=Dreissena polymorpha TaxID=45954 RepID=A0A9D4E9Z3_DREPO|nr:cytochrome b-c1 complex subunit Rieske, mitochondrial-like [Dreissena polymorpha]KAH3775315.1 hypothetical protein DPMN_176716 [Dreissena polymorpha]